MAYFTMIADEQGNVETLGDIYGLDAAVTAAVRGKAETTPATAAPTPAPVPMPARSPKTEEGLATRSP
jgi:hypothetical protein